MEPRRLSGNKLSLVLKACLFATGCSAIVAEYTLATLASYLLGNAIIQWTLVVSLMLFAMGLGSRFTRNVDENLLDRYVVVECALSLACALSALACYSVAAFTSQIGITIYVISILIGFLTGMEIPLIARVNARFESLKVNISSVLEYDYYGALVGGGLFAFLLLPYLGLTYTPILLGAVNLSVAAILIWFYSEEFELLGKLRLSCGLVIAIILLAGTFAKPIVLFGEQHKYKDKIVYEKQTRYQKIVVTQWKNDYWLFLNGSIQFSTFDEERYHEPLVHPAMSLVKERKNILILGGGDGLAVREVLKYPDVESVTLVDLDPAMTELGQTHEVFLKANKEALNQPRVQVINEDALKYLRNQNEYYDVILVDLPDPKTASLSMLYSVGFYRLAKKYLKPHGVLTTQSSSPLYSPLAFLCVKKSLEAAGFSVLPYQNSVPTMGQWGWNLAISETFMTEERLKDIVSRFDFKMVKTRFLNPGAMLALNHFGKDFFDRENEIVPNTEFDHKILEYYRRGDWDIY
jgi:spermidine synthase